MDTMHISPVLSATASVSAARGITRFTLVRILLALLAICLPVALVLILSNQIPDKALRAYWTPLLAALLGYAGYAVYVRKVEARALDELRGPGVVSELGKGVVLGALLFLAVLGVVAASGHYTLTGTGSWSAVAKSFTEMVFIALVEEILFRGVLFRIPERSLGSWLALGLSSIIFALAHLPNEHLTLLAIANTFMAGLLFAAAYLATRRLWLTVGMHFAWNFISSGVFSVPTSGNPGRGLLQGQLSGPEWLSGGAYGLEGSALSFIAMALATMLLLRHALRAGHLLPRGYPGKA